MILAKQCFIPLCLGTENADTGQKERWCDSAAVDLGAVNCFEQRLKGECERESATGESLRPVVHFKKHS